MADAVGEALGEAVGGLARIVVYVPGKLAEGLFSVLMESVPKLVAEHVHVPELATESVQKATDMVKMLLVDMPVPDIPPSSVIDRLSSASTNALDKVSKVVIKVPEQTVSVVKDLIVNTGNALDHVQRVDATAAQERVRDTCIEACCFEECFTEMCTFDASWRWRHDRKNHVWCDVRCCILFLLRLRLRVL